MRKYWFALLSLGGCAHGPGAGHPAWFPFAPAATPIATAFNGRVEVLALPPNEPTVRRVRLDADGAVEGSSPLPFDHVHSAVACGTELVVTGTRTADRRVGAAGIDGRGQVIWQLALHPEAEALGGIIASCAGAHAELLWRTMGAPKTLYWQRLPDGAPAAALDLGEPATLSAAPGQDGLVLAASSHGGIELVRLSGGAPRERTRAVEDDASQPAIVHAGDRYALTWLDGSHRTLWLRWFDARLSPLYPAERLATSGVGVIERAELIAAGLERLALLFQVGLGDRAGGGGPAELELDRLDRLYLVKFDARAAVWSKPVELTPSGRFAGAWLDQRLLVVHGEPTPLISMP